jgi:tetratricopeptide (TPR) repeat protein
MAYIAFGLVIIFLATLVGALFTGVISSSNRSVRTAAERQVQIASSALSSPNATGAEWGPYIEALIAAGDLRQASAALRTARGSTEASVTPVLDLAEARLQYAKGRYEQAVAMAEASMKGYEERRDKRVEAAGDAATASDLTPASEYFDAALVKGYSCVELKRWKDAIAMFDLYIERVNTASDVLIDRGNAKAELGDKAGAEADFREALRFVPYDEEAKAGLKRIGAAQ